jgi:hypothetical protein
MKDQERIASSSMGFNFHSNKILRRLLYVLQRSHHRYLNFYREFNSIHGVISGQYDDERSIG